MQDDPNFNVNDEFGASIRVCADPTDPTCQTRVILRQPATVINQGQLPLIDVAQFAESALSSSYAATASISNKSSFLIGFPEYSQSINSEILSISSSLLSLSGSYNSGSFSGSFFGDGSGLTNIPTSLDVIGNSGSGVINLLTDSLTISGSNGVITTVTNNVIAIKLPNNIISESSQINYNNLQNIPIGIVSSSTQFKNLSDPFSGSFQAKTVELNNGNSNFIFSSSRHDGIVAETRDIFPIMPFNKFAGVNIEYNAQRGNSTRTGNIIASWANQTASYTDFSNVDVGDTRDLLFEVVCAADHAKLRAYSAGSGSGAWNIQVLFKLFPVLI